jgi:hypothetical protein
VSVEQVTMYRVICDRCGETAQQDDYYAWADFSQALDEARDAEWLITDDGDWCHDCVIPAETDEGYAPNPEPVAAP